MEPRKTRRGFQPSRAPETFFSTRSGAAKKICRRSAWFRYDAAALSVTSANSPACKTRKERRQLGRSLREEVRRLSHGDWNAKQRNFDVVDLLRKANRGRLSKLLPLKWPSLNEESPRPSCPLAQSGTPRALEVAKTLHVEGGQQFLPGANPSCV